MNTNPISTCATPGNTSEKQKGLPEIPAALIAAEQTDVTRDPLRNLHALLHRNGVPEDELR